MLRQSHSPVLDYPNHSLCRVQTMKALILKFVTDLTIRGSNPGEAEIFRTRPDWPWGPSSLLYNGYRVCFPGVKRPGPGVEHPPSSNARVKERVEPYLYSPSEPSWTVLGRALLYFTSFRNSVQYPVTSSHGPRERGAKWCTYTILEF
jgi:hypothetical protein